jgi:mannose-1-phosphate guanylyltransferase
LSRSQYPKQVLHLLGSGSLLQTTIERLLPWIPLLERLGVVTSTAQADIIKIWTLHGWYDLKLWLEPHGRNTAPACSTHWPLLSWKLKSNLPSWGFSRRSTIFRTMRDFLRLWSKAGYLVTFGIVPTLPDTGYGYIQDGAPLKPEGIGFSVQRFIEKPDPGRAEDKINIP